MRLPANDQTRLLMATLTKWASDPASQSSLQYLIDFNMNKLELQLREQQQALMYSEAVRAAALTTYGQLSVWKDLNDLLSKHK